MFIQFLDDTKPTFTKEDMRGALEEQNIAKNRDNQILPGTLLALYNQLKCASIKHFNCEVFLLK